MSRRLSWRAIKRWRLRSIAITVGILLEVILVHLAFEGIIITFEAAIISFEAAMTITKFACALPLILLLHVVGGQGITGTCNPNQIPSGSSLFGTVGTLLGILEQDTPLYDNNLKATLIDASTGAVVYGQAICSVSDSLCTACLTNLGNSIWNFCNNAIAGQVESGDQCSILYDITQSSTP